MLVSVDDNPWLRPRDVGIQTVEPVVHLILLIVNSARGIVRQEDVNRWKSAKESLDFRLIVEEMPAGFVPPRSVKAAETDTAVFTNAEMQVHDRFRERCVRVMIAFDGEND